MIPRLSTALLVGSLDVRMRPPVETFLERAPALYASSAAPLGEPEIRAKVQRLADEVFGPYPRSEHG